VDYFIGGLDAEVPELAAKNYSERLVLIPGIGAHPVFPNYVRKNPTPSEFLINCCWTTPKINYPMLEALKEIRDRATVKVKFQFFPSWTAGRYQGTIPLLQGLMDIFGEDYKLYFDTPYHGYLELLENGRFSLDSYPFGGYNTVVDSLFVGCPVVTLEGTRFFNKASSALMRKVELPELITSSREHYITKALLLIDNPQMLQNMRDKITNTDLKTLLVDTNEPQYFADAIDYLITNHNELKTQSHEKPIILAQ
jgi:predicted O-linked N-acetylglucosamine transferase (SPINDLY family)